MGCGSSRSSEVIQPAVVPTSKDEGEKNTETRDGPLVSEATAATRQYVPKTKVLRVRRPSRLPQPRNPTYIGPDFSAPYDEEGRRQRLIQQINPHMLPYNYASRILSRYGTEFRGRPVLVDSSDSQIDFFKMLDKKIEEGHDYTPDASDKKY